MPGSFGPIRSLISFSRHNHPFIFALLEWISAWMVCIIFQVPIFEVFFGGARHHLRSLAPVMNEYWWLWWPNDIRGTCGPKASWHLSYRWGKPPKKKLTQKTCPDRGLNPAPLRDLFVLSWRSPALSWSLIRGGPPSPCVVKNVCMWSKVNSDSRVPTGHGSLRPGSCESCKMHL